MVLAELEFGTATVTAVTINAQPPYAIRRIMRTFHEELLPIHGVPSVTANCPM